MTVRICAAAVLLMMLAGHGPAAAADYPRAAVGAYHAYYVVAPVPLPLLIGPGDGYGLLAMVPANARLPIVTCEYRTGWCKVRFGRYDGWVYDPLRDRPPSLYSSIFGH